MKNLLLSAVILFSLILPAIAEAAPISKNFQWRCGWLSNPTPSNIWLNDRDGEWIIAMQGGYQTPGDWPWPDFQAKEWVKTNVGNHGYGCACLKMKVDPQNHHVLQIKNVEAKTLKTCRQDRFLKEQN